MYFSDIAYAALKTGILLLTCSIFSFLVFLSIILYEKISKEKQIYRNEAIGTSFAFGMLAVVAGIVMSASRGENVSSVLPGVLTFVGGVAIFLIAKEKSRSLVVGSAVVSFSALFILGTTLGYYDRYRANRQVLLDKYDLETQKWIADSEYRIETYRKALRLPRATGGDN